jgi:hypothetical protein
MIINPYVFGGAAPTPSNTYIGTTVDGSVLTTFTFTGVSIGAADSTRRVVVACSNDQAAARTVSSATIAGGAATVHVTPSSLEASAIFSRLVPTGTTATITVTWSGICAGMLIHVWSQINETSATPTATANDVAYSAGVLSATINIPANGCLYGASATNQGASYSWTNTTERYDNPDPFGGADGTVYSAASSTGLSLETPRTITATIASPSSPVGSLVLVSWG